MPAVEIPLSLVAGVSTEPLMLAVNVMNQGLRLYSRKERCGAGVILTQSVFACWLAVYCYCYASYIWWPSRLGQMSWPKNHRKSILKETSCAKDTLKAEICYHHHEILVWLRLHGITMDFMAREPPSSQLVKRWTVEQSLCKGVVLS